jgi:predicted ribosome quality control (RQC) complex YloA/Tae2 family protein
MANAIEDALDRASAEQQAKAQQVIEEARRNIKLVSVRDDITTTDADSIAKNAQAIEEAKRAIPFETMKDVESIDPPLDTPAPRGYYNSTVVELHSNTQTNIEQIEQGEGNNYLRENAVDRAMARPAQEVDREQPQQSLGR